MCQSSVSFAAICRPMACPRSLAHGYASATSFVVPDAASTLEAVQCFMGEITSSVESSAYSSTCCVSHPDGLQCVCKTKVFELPAGVYILELARLKGDSMLFALVFRLLQAFMATGQQPELVCGQLFKRCRLAPASDPAVVPPIELPPAF